MTNSMRRLLTGPALPGAMLGFAFLVSCLLYALVHPSFDGRIFFFPDNSGSHIGAERRGVPHRADTAGEIEVFLRELMLGPVALKWSGTAPENTSVRHVLVRDKAVYVDFGSDILEEDPYFVLDTNAALSNIEYNILFNFPRLDRVVITIEGQQIHAPYYDGESENTGNELSFFPKTAQKEFNSLTVSGTPL